MAWLFGEQSILICLLYFACCMMMLQLVGYVRARMRAVRPHGMVVW
jgi:hypothetical protein